MTSEVEEVDFGESTNLFSAQDLLAGRVMNVTSYHLETIRPDHSRTRWNKLSDRYNDQYLDVFNETWGLKSLDDHFETTQLGSIIWTGDEKSKLFEALDRKGRHDMPALAELVETKSVAEVRQYILHLEEARDDRQRFSRNAKSITQPDIDAAVEVEADLEEQLEENADALAAFQDFYNYSEARSRAHSLWLIDTELADLLSGEDVESDERVDIDDEKFLLSFFKFDTMLELSRALFMNVACNSEHDHWSAYAQPSEEPSLTLESARHLYELIKSLVMRILQTAIFLTESRLRATATPGYTPTRVIKDSDVLAAVDVLNMSADSSDYWCKFIERSGLDIVVGGHRKGHASAAVTVAQAQLILATKRGRDGVAALSEVLDSSPPQGSPSSMAHDLDDPSEDTEESAPDEVSDSSVSGHEYREEDIGTHSEKLTGNAGRRKRRAMIEAAEDEFMEALDHQASVAECYSLRKRLDIAINESNVKVEDARRPKKLRKLKDDLGDWTNTNYIASWEESTAIIKEEHKSTEDLPIDSQ